MDLLTPGVTIKLERWLQASLSELASLRDSPSSAPRMRPAPLAIGQGELKEWARGLVWDFTFERNDTCGVPLYFTLPIETHLNLTYISRRLHNYADQHLLSYLLEGVRLEADVELQTVLIPHLTSLPPGYASVRKEILRLHNKGWYQFFGTMPYWPLYCNGQGATPRKLEPDPWRRTTEGGGPRQPLFDASGLQAWSINEASKIHHFPQHFAGATRLEFLRWLEHKQLPRTAEQQVEDAQQRSKWPHELKPTLADAIRDLCVLKAASATLRQPLYIFGDDAADYFNQLAMAPEEWWKLNIVFIKEDEVLRTQPQHRDQAGNTLFFVSERRLGFGTHPASNIAQRFSDAILHLSRQDMDAADAPFLAADTSPEYLEWRAARARIRQRDEPNPTNAQQRLYFAHMYTDDPVLAVVGVDRALRALRIWRTLTACASR